LIDLGRFGPPLARELLGDERLVATAVEGFVGPFEDCFAVRASASLVLGLRLAGGGRVAVKLVPPREPYARLEAARAVQRALHGRGFPSPRPLAGPTPVGRGYALVDEWRDVGEFRDTREPRLRRAMAARFAELLEAASAVPEATRLPRALAGLWERPHHPRFDFARPDGAWIDEAATGVREAVFGPVQDWAAGHADWNAQHVRWAEDEIVTIYDWDLVRDSEASLVGYASAVFTATWELSVPKAPSPAESEAFVADYERAAGRRLDRGRVAAARTYLLAYAARCELSDLGGAEGDFQRALRLAASA
jgi:hypothetical protein